MKTNNNTMRKEWVKSGAYRTIPFSKWVRRYSEAVDKVVENWFRA